MSTAPTVIPERVAALDTITLDSGNHCNFSEGHCAMEVVAWLAGLGHTDAPECASPVLRDFTVGLNDRWDTVQRQTLKPFLPRMVGTAGDGQDEARAYLALDWLVRTYAPEWLDVAGLTERARDLRDLPRIVDPASAQSAVPVAHAARQDAAAAWDAARAAAWDAARAAAGDAAGDAARAAARDAAGDAAGDAAWAAAGDAAWAAAGAAAGAAAWDAARDAAWDSLAPTVAALQASALDLLDRMIDPGAATA
jgi:hypothetical protein